MSTNANVNPGPNACSDPPCYQCAHPSTPTILLAAGLRQMVWLATAEGVQLSARLHAQGLPAVQQGALFVLSAREVRHV